MLLTKKIASKLPDRWQNEIKRLYYARQIKKNVFFTDEPEYSMLDILLSPGDWVIDVGANIGHYTKKLSELVGPSGRVIALEPVPDTFSLLSANVSLFPYTNISLFNAAASDKLAIVGVSVPIFPSGLSNYYEAHISSASNSMLSVLTITLDSLCVDHPIRLVKIDAEGHEDFVLRGMRGIIQKYKPVLIVENPSNEAIRNLISLGYLNETLPKSPNVLFRPIKNG